MFGVPPADIAALAAGIVLGGVVTGLLAGLFGIGGGAVIVPVLYEVFRVLGVPDEVRMQLCVGTSLAIIVPTSIRSFMAHRAKGNLPVEIVRMWAPPIAIALLIGALIAAFVPATAFKLIFAVFALLMALRMFLASDWWRLGDRLPGRGVMWGIGFLTGIQSAVMGTGGGAISTL